MHGLIYYNRKMDYHCIIFDSSYGAYQSVTLFSTSEVTTHPACSSGTLTILTAPNLE